MSDGPMQAALRRLIAESLTLWGVADRVAIEGHDADHLRLIGPTGPITIGRAPASVPFRWMVTIGERQRPAGSVTGVLRIVRAAVAPEGPSSRVRIAPAPILPP